MNPISRELAFFTCFHFVFSSSPRESKAPRIFVYPLSKASHASPRADQRVSLNLFTTSALPASNALTKVAQRCVDRQKHRKPLE